MSFRLGVGTGLIQSISLARFASVPSKESRLDERDFRGYLQIHQNPDPPVYLKE
jgi:hypothetical protein